MSGTTSEQLCRISTEVKDHFDPVISKIGITYASHIRLFDDGKAFEISNNPKYLEHFFDKKYAIPEPGTYTKPGMHIWSHIPALKNYDSRLADMRNCFNIDHQIGIIYPGKDYIDRFALGTTRDRPDMINYYINNKDVLDNMFLEYKDKFSDVLGDLSKAPLSMPLRPRNFKTSDELFNDFSNITTREFECLQYLAQGMCSKIIARRLNISPRTVDRHLENIREKLNVRCKIEIINKYRDYQTSRA